jgi:hypothetical protein
MMRLPEKAKDILGTMTDKSVGEIYGMPTQKIHSIRTSLNIPPFRKHSTTHLKKLSKKEFEALRELLGTEKDIELAKLYGVSREYIRQLRKKYNIIRYKK